MNIISTILYIICVLFAVGWGILMRHKAKTEQATEKIFEVFGLLMVISLILIPVLSISPFHLLWMLPVSFLFGPLSFMFPFRLLWPLASLYGAIWYLGLKPKKGNESGTKEN